VAWTELVEGLRAATAVLDCALEGPARTTGDADAVTAPAVLVVSGSGVDAGPEIFTAELTWPEYALVQRLHFLDHRTQVRQLRAALAAGG
jgi:hypothetical protein